MGQLQEAVVDIGGRAFTIVSDDDYLVHVGKEFEPETARLFNSLAMPSDCSVDVGANIGCTSLLLGGLTRCVHSFEPSPTTFQLLSHNIVLSGLKNITAHNIGIGSVASESTLTFFPKNRSGGFVSNLITAGDGHVTEVISVQKLDDVVSSLNIASVDFLKVDVEGFEPHVLQGAAATLSAHRPVVVLELNHWCLNAFQRISVPDFFDQLRATFPILLAVNGAGYMDLHNESDSYTVMYNHILRMAFPTVVGCFDCTRLGRFRMNYRSLGRRE